MGILVIGSKGIIGRHLCQSLQEKNIQFFAPSEQDLDINQHQHWETYINNCKPSIVVNTASFDKLSAAEKSPSVCFKINRDTASVLAEICRTQNIPLIHISSYRVFDGQQREPYSESDAPNPVGVLAISRFQAEKQVQERCPQHIILRFSWVVSEQGENVLTSILNQIIKKDIVSVTSDQIGCPTPVEDTARVIIAIIQQVLCDAKAWGTYHYAAAETVSLNALTEFVIAEAKQYTQLKVKKLKLAKIGIKSGIHPPANACLNCPRILRAFGIHRRSWHIPINHMVENYFRR